MDSVLQICPFPDSGLVILHYFLLLRPLSKCIFNLLVLLNVLLPIDINDTHDVCQVLLHMWVFLWVLYLVDLFTTPLK